MRRKRAHKPPGLPRTSPGKVGRGQKTHKFVTQKSWCTPSRLFVERAYQPLGIRAKFGDVIYIYDRDDDGRESPFPSYQEQTVTVNESQADWAEYVLGAISAQTGIEVIAGIRSQRNFDRGRARLGVPMPWLYDALNGAPRDDSVKACVGRLPPDKRKDAMDAIKRGEINPRIGAANLVYTHEGNRKRRKSKRGSRSKRGDKSKRDSRARGRGSHRGAHRGR